MCKDVVLWMNTLMTKSMNKIKRCPSVENRQLARLQIKAMPSKRGWFSIVPALDEGDASAQRSATRDAFTLDQTKPVPVSLRNLSMVKK